ncbi:hypothetical protein ALC57_08086 [Trachymyrmex cornetzi]|uniref:Uncharacterized protein n=1 Tax=Trachymyrmex cornetzi TaxID=471704 RepID=A0A195E368_9HYME|nr:hypothetical protein ALC57_08086 [Trachymyrmex cornetzi]
MLIDSDRSYRQGLFFYNRSARKNWANQGQIIKTHSDERKITHVSDEVHAHIYLSIFVSYLPLLDSIKRKRGGDRL